MKLIKIGEDRININSIWKISTDGDHAHLHIIGQENSIFISKETLDRVLEFSKSEEIEIEKATKNNIAFGF